MHRGLAVLVLATLASCAVERTGDAGPGEGGGGGGGGAGGSAGSGGEGGDPIEPGRVKVRLEEDGAPVSGSVVWVHDASGAFTGGVITGEDGIAVIEDVPPAGVGITLPTSAITPGARGLSTILGLHAGDELLLGTAAPRPPVELTYTLPAAFPGATQHVLVFPCRSTPVTPGTTGALLVDATCVPGASFPVLVQAATASGEVLALATLPAVAVDGTDPIAPAAHADLAAAGWTTEVAALRIVASGALDSASTIVQATWPGPRETLGLKYVGPEVLEPGASLELALRLPPGVGPVHHTTYRHVEDGAESRDTRHTAVVQPPAPGTAGATEEIHVNQDVPSFAAGLSISESWDWVTMSVPTNGRCAGRTGPPDATVYTVRAMRGDITMYWQVMTPDGGSIFHLPQLPAAASGLWPVPELELERVMVSSTWLTSGYAGLLGQRDPFFATELPPLGPGDHHCGTFTEVTR